MVGSMIEFKLDALKETTTQNFKILLNSEYYHTLLM